MLVGQLHGLGHADDVRHVLGARTAAGFLVPADHKRPAGRTAFDVQGPDPLRRVQLVAGEREQVDVPVFAFQVDGQLADRLRGVGVKENGRIGLFGQTRKLFDGKDHARLVVGVHDRNQQGLRRQGADELADVEVSLAIDAQEGHVITVPLQILADFENGRMLDDGGDDMPPVRVRAGGAHDGRVVALGSAGGEENLTRPN